MPMLDKNMEPPEEYSYFHPINRLFYARSRDCHQLAPDPSLETGSEDLLGRRWNVSSPLSERVSNLNDDTPYRRTKSRTTHLGLLYLFYNRNLNFINEIYAYGNMV